MSAEPILQIRNVSKIISSKTIVSNLSLDVYPGEVLGFLGPNGAGKTTTIRMILGLMKISSGEIYIKGHSVKGDFEKAIDRVGGIVENPDMYKYLTGYENLVHYARMYNGITKERIQEVINFSGLGARINDKVKTYSLGMKQRLGVAQALINSPSLLVLDEPTNGLDPAGIHQLRNELRNLAEQKGMAIFVSSHMLSEMELMCDRVAIIQNGHLLKVLTIDEIRRNPGSSVVSLLVDPIDKAYLYIKGLDESLKPAINGNQLMITTNWQNIPSIVEKLVKEGFKIYGVQQFTESLEQRFLEMTGGDQIV